MPRKLRLSIVALSMFMIGLFLIAIDGSREGAAPPPPSAIASAAPPPSAAPSARTLREIADLPPAPPSEPRREIDPNWKMPHPVLTPLERRAAEAVEAVALRDGFAVRSVTCKRQGAWQICDLCYSHPLRYYGQIRVACNKSRCEWGFGNDDPRSAGLNLNFCETH